MEGREWEGKTDEGEGKEGAVAAGGGGGGRRGRPPRAAFVKGQHSGPPPKCLVCQAGGKVNLAPGAKNPGAASGREREEMERLCP
jgi:hypothetical protein